MSIALGEVELDLETNAVFGNLAKDSAQAFAAALTGLSPVVHPPAADPERPPKAPKLELGKRGRPSDSSHSGGRNHGQGQGSKGQGKGGKGGKTSPQVTALVKAMGRLVIRQETQLQILKQNSAWWVYLQPGVNGPIPVLFKAAEKYKEQAKVKFMESPIRAVLLGTLFLTLSHCLQTLSTDANQQKSARDKGWLTQGNEWRYQKWDVDNQVLQIDEARAPVPHQELVGLVSKIAELVTHRDVVHRFNATHPITVDKEGVSTFMLEIGLRARGVEDTWNGLETLANLAALQIIGMQIRRESLRRGGLANEVQRLLQTC